MGPLPLNQPNTGSPWFMCRVHKVGRIHKALVHGSLRLGFAVHDWGRTRAPLLVRACNGVFCHTRQNPVIPRRLSGHWVFHRRTPINEGLRSHTPSSIDPIVAAESRGSITPYPLIFWARAQNITASHPIPTAARTHRPISRSPDIGRTGRYRDKFSPRSWRRSPRESYCWTRGTSEPT